MFGLKNINHEICRKCKGKFCCQQIGCALKPEDFDDKITKELLVERLKSDIVFSVMPTNADTEYTMLYRGQLYGILFIPRIKGKRDAKKYLVTKKMANNPCMYWDRKTGCSFSDEERPYGGVALIPNQGEACINGYEESPEQEKDWLPYQKMIISILKSLNAL